MANYKARGIVCTSHKLGEADRIIHLYTENGMVRAVAKGVRKTKSKFGGRLEPLSYVNLVLFKGRNLDTICQVELIEHFKSLRKDFKKLAHGLIIADFINSTAQHESHLGELFSDSLNALKGLDEGLDKDIVLLSFIANSLVKLGYAIDLDNCLKCGVDLTVKSYFNPESGGLLCRDCWYDNEWSVELGEKTRLFMKGLLGNPDLIQETDSEENRKMAGKIFRSFINYHMDVNLRSYRFIDRISNYPEVGGLV